MKKITFLILAAFLLFIPIEKSDASSVKTIGLIYSADLSFYRIIHGAVIKYLNKYGVDTRKIKFIRQRPFPDVVSWNNAARKLVVYDSDIIIAYGSGAAEAAFSATSSIPVIYGAIDHGLSKIKKIKNGYGSSYTVPIASFIRYLREAKDVNNLAVVYSPFEPDTVVQYRQFRQICKELSINVTGIPVKSVSDIESMLKLEQFDALFLTGSAIVNYRIKTIYEICRGKKVPVLSIFDGTEEYSLLTITPDADRIGRAMAHIIYKLITGRGPVKKRHVLVTKTKIYFNLRLTTELGLRIPMRLVTSADKVIK
ncbi:ABC transporter substrate binding protein [bacterium BMS3Abin07]|nr:ABC transporter substrate binding protein [bacterium BMS3Abin07]GBE32574.1 ABC transporter substrate binding protein [bacterium BMS3Bbin05]